MSESLTGSLPVTESRLCLECGSSPRMTMRNGRAYRYCSTCFTARAMAGKHPDRYPTVADARQALVTRATVPVLPTAMPAVTPETPRGSDVPGILADMLLVLDRSREAVARGEVSAFRIAIEAGGVRIHMGTEGVE